MTFKIHASDRTLEIAPANGLPDFANFLGKLMLEFIEREMLS